MRIHIPKMLPILLTFAMGSIALAQAPDDVMETPAATTERVPPGGPQAIWEEMHRAAQNGNRPTFRAGLSREYEQTILGFQALAAIGPDADEKMERTSWNAFMAQFAADKRRAIDAKQTGNMATLSLVGPDGVVGHARMLREDGSWRVALPQDIRAELERLRQERAAQKAPPGVVTVPQGDAPPLPKVRRIPKFGGFYAPQSWADLSTLPATETWLSGWRPADYTYLIDTALVVSAATTVYSLGALGIVEPNPKLGPEFNLADPDLATLNDPRLDDVVGAPYVGEKVSFGAVAAMGIGTPLIIALLDAGANRNLKHTAVATGGGYAALIATFTVTEALKLGVGRLRPDFRDRYTRAACTDETVPLAEGTDCSAVLADGFTLTRKDVITGMRSFPSGHTSTAFAAATYASLYLGGEWVWGHNASAYSAPVAMLGVTTLLGGASFVAASRIADKRHHPEDVAVGSVIGAGIAAASYFLYFDLDGNVRQRGAQVTPLVYEGGGGLALSGKF